MSTDYTLIQPGPNQPLTVSVDEGGRRFSIDLEANTADNEGHAAIWGVGLDGESDVALCMATTSRVLTPEQLVDIAVNMMVAAGYHIDSTAYIVDAFERKRKEHLW